MEQSITRNDPNLKHESISARIRHSFSHCVWEQTGVEVLQSDRPSLVSGRGTEEKVIAAGKLIAIQDTLVLDNYTGGLRCYIGSQKQLSDEDALVSYTPPTLPPPCSSHIMG
ncbi:hypothetical protein Baya_6018 [Bagarius yarrelli]|uniref:Uncharacterized protein n=1 Tax=Bagarius yarrelli TaxID=175774 RepID=A0A556U0T4_BAGYA|nr:hypothetical protein Baya_6018 [Bagarius yarrelli]